MSGEIPEADTMVVNSDPAATSTESRSEVAIKRRRVRAYLTEQTQEGVVYCKSRQIAAALGEEHEFSSKEIGQAMLALSKSASGLVIERWSYTSATTWRVEQIEPAPSTDRARCP